jgi:hypothetical protein
MSFSIFLILLVVSLLGGVSTYLFSQKLNFSSVLASTLLSLIVALVFLAVGELGQSGLSSKIPVVFIGASFVGMSSVQNLKNIQQVAFASLIFGIVFLSASSLFAGFGGGLGTSAAIGVICNIGLQRILDRV